MKDNQHHAYFIMGEMLQNGFHGLSMFLCDISRGIAGGNKFTLSQHKH